MVGTTVKLLQKLKLKKLNAAGVAHHALIAVLVVSGFASFGAYQVFKSKAATNNVAPPLSAQGLKEDGCVPGEHKVTNNDKPHCEAFVKIDKIKDDCALYNLPYGSDNKRCRTGICLDGFEKKGPDCVKKARTTPTTPPVTDQGGGTAQQTDNVNKEMCNLLGRKLLSGALCTRVCQDGGGNLLKKDATYYCEHAVALVIDQARCTELHRKWATVGCARLIGQQDTLNAAQCLASFPYYNANFTPKNGDGTKTDVCEKDKKTATQNEQSGNLGGVQVGGTKPTDPGQTDDCGADDTSARCLPQDPGDDTNAAKADYRIVLYKEKDFKGDSLDVTASLKEDGTVSMTVKNGLKKLDATDMSKMPKGWNDKIKSFKILKGRWQLCEDADYKTGCIKPYASEPNLTDGKDKKQISSVQPFVATIVDETVEETPAACLDGNGLAVPPNSDGKCPDNSKLSCPVTNEDGATLELHNGQCVAVTVEADVIVPVDKDFKGKQGERKCQLLGREWISKGNGGENGCSIETCRNNKDGRPRTVQVTGDSDDDTQKRTDTVCVSYRNDAPYAVKLDPKAKQSQKKCEALSRVWIEQVKLCAQVPNRDDKDHTIVKAEQCAGKKTTYYIFKEKAKTDECFSPSYFDRAKGAAKSVKGSLVAALKQGPKAYCNTVKGGNYHWQDNKCAVDRRKCPNGKLVAVNQNCPTKPCSDGSTVFVGQNCPVLIDTTYCDLHPNEVPRCKDVNGKVDCGKAGIKANSRTDCPINTPVGCNSTPGREWKGIYGVGYCGNRDDGGGSFDCGAGIEAKDKKSCPHLSPVGCAPGTFVAGSSGAVCIPKSSDDGPNGCPPRVPEC
jgi:hypothetical protein